jgi:hypothetical protein
MKMLDKKRFVESTMWLRPFTRWATRFAMNAPPWLPTWVRNAPLKLFARILRAYHKAMR